MESEIFEHRVFTHPNYAFHNLINISRYLDLFYSTVLRYEAKVPVSEDLQTKIVELNRTVHKLIGDYLDQVTKALGQDVDGKDRFEKTIAELDKIDGYVREGFETDNGEKGKSLRQTDCTEDKGTWKAKGICEKEGKEK